MRVIAGEFKGRTLYGPPAQDRRIRPSSDRVREALFNHLIHQGLDFHGSHGLDLYAGTGALGIEAVSRGAAKVVWLENHSKALNILRKNLESLNLTDPGSFCLLNLNVLHLFQNEDSGVQFLESFVPFRWIFLDPPYAQKQTPALIQKMARKNCLLFEPGGWLVLETSAKDPCDFRGLLHGGFGERLEGGLEYFSERIYGDTKLHCWRFLPDTVSSDR